MNQLLLIAALLTPSASAAPRAPRLKVAKVLNAPVTKIDGLAGLKGKVVFLEFWATWCAPCVAGIPRTNRLIDALKGQPVVFLSVTDEPAETIEAFRKTHEIKAWIGIDVAGAALKAYHVTGRPAGYLIGKDGSLLASVFPDELKEKDVRDAIAGRFAPKPVVWDDAPAPKAAGAPAGKTYFEARISEAAGKPNMMSGLGEFEASSLDFASNVAWIWSVEHDQVLVDTGIPASFNFSLKTRPDGFEDGRELMKAAVQSAFDVRVTSETRETDAFVLALSTAAGAPRPKLGGADVKSGLVSYGGGRLLGKAAFPEVAHALWMSLDKPVLDETGLGGEYEFDLEWNPDDRAALERLLAAQGLLLVPARRTVDFLHVARAAAP